MSDLEEFFNPAEQSDFNAALATLERCHTIKVLMCADTMNEDYTKLFLRLKAFYKELFPILNSKEKEEATSTYLKCRDIYNLLKTKQDVTTEQLDSIEEWELQLREYEQKHKMNMPMGKDARFAMAN